MRVLLTLSLMLFVLSVLARAQQDYILDSQPRHVTLSEDHDDITVPLHNHHLYDSFKCNDGIVGLFCQNSGCFYNSDCFDDHCNMYSKCEKKVRNSHIMAMEKEMHETNAMKSKLHEGLASNGTSSEGDDKSVIPESLVQ